MTIKELHTLEEMLSEIDVMKELYPDLTPERYRSMLEEMIPHNYKQVAVYDRDICAGISGFWVGTKLWCGKYLELDNVIVAQRFRQMGIGKLLSDYLDQKAKELGCNIQALDAYTHNFKAHRFYYNQGFSPKGFHFVKILNKDGIL